jgi:hypothetical protein
MNTSLFKRLAHELLQKHYGIDFGDTSISSERVAGALVKQGVRPFEAVNQHAQACDLDRIDKQGSFGVPGKEPLTLQDELAILAFVRPVILLGDQPTCCPYCSSRTDFDELENGQQHHRCLNSWCGCEFLAEPDEELEPTH